MSVSLNKKPTKAWVVFDEREDAGLLGGFLKCGYEHCFIVLNDGNVWMTIDPLSTGIEIETHQHLTPDYDLIAWLQERYTAVVGCNPVKRKGFPLTYLSCVEVCKRMLGINKWWILTPHQLYRFIIRRNEKYYGGKRIDA